MIEVLTDIPKGVTGIRVSSLFQRHSAFKRIAVVHTLPSSGPPAKTGRSLTAVVTEDPRGGDQSPMRCAPMCK
jgi:hypothetical protein